jgi:hypothetical protein
MKRIFAGLKIVNPLRLHPEQTAEDGFNQARVPYRLIPVDRTVVCATLRESLQRVDGAEVGVEPTHF